MNLKDWIYDYTLAEIREREKLMASCITELMTNATLKAFGVPIVPHRVTDTTTQQEVKS